MDIKSKSYSHFIITKVVVFLFLWFYVLQVLLKKLVEIEVLNGGDFWYCFFEDNYFLSEAYVRESENVIGDLTRLIGEYKNEEHIFKRRDC
ncbi:hypothetical protein GCM10020331_020530 [Ectobacillus funiculus]